MFEAFTEEMRFLLSNALTAGALGVAVTTFALPQKARKEIAPFLLFIGSIASLSLLLSAVVSSVLIFQTISWIPIISIILFCCGVFVLPISVIYIVYKLLRVKILIGDRND